MSTLQPRAALTKSRLTAEEFWELVHRPENADRFLELIRGEVVEMSRPTHQHGRVCSRLCYLLERYAEEAGWGYPVANDAGIILERSPDTVVGPDVAFFAQARSFDDLAPQWSETIPILAVEILSPNDRLNRVLAKIQRYLARGVKLVWLIDYEERTVSVFRPNHEPDVLSDDAELDGGSALPGFRCRLSEVFRLPGEGASGRVAGLPADRSPPSGAGGEGDRRSASGEATGES